MEYRFLINYTSNGQPESLEVITESSQLSVGDAQKRVEAANKPYGKTDIGSIQVKRIEAAENIDTDPATSASE